MNRYPREPLTQEERELAQLIARVGAHGEPPASLDAKILSAAHAAVNNKPQRARKPRWPVAMGLAASAVFAVGIAWQLRPLQPAAPLSSEAPASAAAEMAARTEAEPATAAAAATPVDEMAQDSAAAAASASANIPMSAPPPPPPPAAKVLPPRTLSIPTPRRAARISPPPEVPPVPRQAQEGDRYHSPTKATSTPPAPPAPAAPVMAVRAPAAEAPSATPSAFTAERRAGAAAEGLSANEAADYSAARTATAKQSAAREESKASATIREQERGVQESAARESAVRDRATLDRVEVTGSRLQHTDRQVPVSNDARLPVDEWLERVRTRYGLGDADAAKRSLLLFVHEHPSETVPSDLEPLLEK